MFELACYVLVCIVVCVAVCVLFVHAHPLLVVCCVLLVVRCWLSVLRCVCSPLFFVVVCCVVLVIVVCCEPFFYCVVGSCVPRLVAVFAVGVGCCLLIDDYCL